MDLTPRVIKQAGMTPVEAKAMADAHWAWLESHLRKVYVDAFVHGIKHGIMSVEQAERSGWKPEDYPIEGVGGVGGMTAELTIKDVRSS